MSFHRETGVKGKGSVVGPGSTHMATSWCASPILLHRNMRSAVQGRLPGSGSAPGGLSRLGLIWRRALSLDSVLSGPLWP